MKDVKNTSAQGVVTQLVRERVLAPLLDQLRQGVSPEKLALALTLGALIGIFPIIGSSTILCVVAGVVLKLNQPAMQVANYLAYPLQIPLVFVFVRIGETILGAPHVSFSVPELMREFNRDPEAFARQFGMTGLRGIFAWAILAVPLGLLIYTIVRPLAARATERFGGSE